MCGLSIGWTLNGNLVDKHLLVELKIMWCRTVEVKDLTARQHQSTSPNFCPNQQRALHQWHSHTLSHWPMMWHHSFVPHTNAEVFDQVVIFVKIWREGRDCGLLIWRMRDVSLSWVSMRTSFFLCSPSTLTTTSFLWRRSIISVNRLCGVWVPTSR